MLSSLNWSKYKPVIQWLLAVVCLIYIAAFLIQRKAELSLTFTIGPAGLLAMFLLIIIFFIINCYRYLLVLEKFSPQKINYFQWFRIYIIGLTINKIIPQLGNIYRSVILKQYFKVAYTNYISSYSSFAWMDLWQNMLLAILVLLAVDIDYHLGGIHCVLLLSCLMFIVICIPLGGYYFSSILSLFYDRPLWIHSKLSEVLSATISSLRDLKFLSIMAFIGVIVGITSCALFFISFKAIGIRLSIPDLVLFYILFKFSTYLNITPGNIGLRELAYGIVGQQIHLNMADGILVSVMLRILNYLVLFALFFILGGYRVLKKNKKEVSLKEQL